MRLAFAAIALASLAGIAAAQNVTGLRYIGQQTIATGTQFQGQAIGGLSGIDLDTNNGSFWAISDDRSSAARFYNLSLSYNLNTFSGVAFNSQTTLLNSSNSPFAAGTLDPESIRRDRSTGTFYWTSEGERNVGASNLQNPFVREMNIDGTYVRELSTPGYYNPTVSGATGIRQNLAFESLTLSTDGATVYAATENALFQDGPAAAVGVGTPSRVISYNKATGAAGAEYIYITEPVAANPIPAGQFATNGLVELLAISSTEFLAVERSFSTGVGNSIKVYKTSIAGASDVGGLTILPGGYTAMSKTLLLDLDTLGITLDNIEGITFGKTLENGNLSVILVADNNFSPTQVTQFLAFEVIPAPGAAALAGLVGLAGLRRRR